MTEYFMIGAAVGALVMLVAVEIIACLLQDK